MTPRRPVPARPGARRTSRPGQARDARSATSRDQADSAAVREAGHAVGADSERARTSDSQRAAAYAGPRLGGADGLSTPMRLLILAGVVLLAFVVVFPSLRGYLTQRAQYDAVLEQIDEARATSTALEEEMARWEDNDYVKAQARERLSYVMPGETTYVVVGADSFGDDADAATSKSAAEARLPWYQELRESARVAGQVEEEPADPARQGWSTATPTPPSAPTPDATATSSDNATPSAEPGDQQ
ncbi:FtsB family cell division protein [Actinomyces sp. 432]|uniref:FtsB family cell division protein n=1 Tax=Actinomyces sp. 432 TaxID=2057798 RepID=UPI001F336C42|nr:septum formation initiator family protein [Actinomyces sp. 432]